MKKLNMPGWLKPDKEVLLRALITGGAMFMISAKLYLLANPIHLAIFIPLFIITFLVFLKLPKESQEQSPYEKRNMFDLGILVLLGFLILNEIWSETDIVSISLLTVMIMYSWVAFRKPGIGELFKTAAMPDREDLQTEPGDWKKSITAFTAGLFVTTICLIILEKRDSFFFTADDNLVQFLPNINLGAKSLFSGIFPAWNPWQCLGTPLVDQGIYALTYPPTYLSYYIAKNILGSELLTLEVFAFMHIIAGFIAAFFVFRKIGISSFIASAASVSFVLSGYILIAGRSWFYMLPLAFWLPIFVLIIHELIYGKPGIKWAVLSGLAIGLFFHAGNVQMWFYTMMFLYIPAIVLFFMGKVGYKRLGWLISATALGIAISAPLLLPQLALTRDLNRSFWGIGIIQGIAAFIFPSPICKGMSTNDIATSASNGHIYYSGTIFFLIAYILFFYLMFYKVSITIFVKKNIWYFLAAIAFIFGMGKAGILWTVALDLPMFSKFSHPFKFIPFITLFVITGGAIVIERIPKPAKNPDRSRILIALAVFALMTYHCFCPLNPFYTYADKPYGKLPEEVMKMIEHGKSANYRIANASEGSVYEVRSDKPGFYNFAPHNYPTIYEIPSAAGYEPFVAKSPLYSKIYDALESGKTKKDIDILRACSVKWIFTYGKNLIGQMSANSELKKIYQFSDPEIAIFEISNPSPIAFRDKDPGSPLYVSYDADGATISMKGTYTGDLITVSFLNRPGLKLETDKRAIEIIQEKNGLVSFKAPGDSEIVSIKYEAPWKKGVAAGAVLFVISVFMIAAMWFIQNAVERKEKDDNHISQSQQNNRSGNNAPQMGSRD